MRPGIATISGATRSQHPGVLQCRQAARRQRQIDGAAAFGRRRARIGTALDQAHALTAAGEHQRPSGRPTGPAPMMV